MNKKGDFLLLQNNNENLNSNTLEITANFIENYEKSRNNTAKNVRKWRGEYYNNKYPHEIHNSLIILVNFYLINLSIWLTSTIMTFPLFRSHWKFNHLFETSGQLDTETYFCFFCSNILQIFFAAAYLIYQDRRVWLLIDYLEVRPLTWYWEVWGRLQSFAAMVWIFKIWIVSARARCLAPISR